MQTLINRAIMLNFRLVFCFSLALIPLSISAQLDEAAAELTEGNCSAAFQTYDNYRSDERLGTAARLGLANVHSTASCEQYDLDKAYELLVELNDWYRSLDKKEKERQQRRGYDHSMYNRLRKRVINNLLQLSLATQEVAVVDQFMADRKALLRRSQISDIAASRNILLLSQLRMEPTIDKLKAAAVQYGSSFSSDSRDLLDSLHHLQLTVWVQEQGWNKWSELLLAFPGNVYALDRGKADFLKVRTSGNPQRFRQFAERNRNSKWQAIAQDSAAATQTRLQNFRLEVEQVMLTLQDSTAREQWPAADVKLQSWLLGGILNQTSTENFLKSLPGERMPLSQDFFRDYYVRRNGELNGLILLQRQFTQYYATQTLQSTIDSLQQVAINKRRANLDQLLVSLADEEQNHRWRESDRLLSQRIFELSKEDYEYSLPKIKALPAQRITTTLYQLYASYTHADPEGGAEQFFTDFPSAAAIEEEVQSQHLKEKSSQFSRLQKKLRPDFRARNWTLALEKVQAENEELADYPPYQELLTMLSRDEPDAPLTMLGGDAVNTEIDEYTPVLSADGKRLYFCRFDFMKEDIHLAELTDSGWVGRGELARFENEKENVAPLSLTVDGNRMLIFNGGTLMYTDRTTEGWSEAKAYPRQINAGAWQGMGALSADGRVLIFETRGRSDMGGGLFSGNTDLYIAFLDRKGKWSEAQSLSKLINTPKIERAPYIHPDMQTLYFSTDARGGLGGLDVFKTTRLDDTWLNWSTPVHLGRNANTTGNDWGYKISTDGSFAYFAADPDGDETQDIYQVNLPPEARPEPVTLLKTRLLQPDGTPVEGELIVEDLETGELVAKLRTEPGTGWITAALPNNRQYALVFEGGKRLPFSDHLDLRTVTESQDLQTEVVLKTMTEALEDKEALTLRNIFFDHNQATLQPSSDAELARVANILIAEAELKITIRGHTDNVGTLDYNQNLSQKRAEAVRAALIRRGVAADRLLAAGLGESQFIASNDTEAGRAKNRRVEMILEKN